MTVARFWRENAERYNLIGCKCGNCGKILFPSRAVCPDCHRLSLGKMEEFKLKGEGEILTFSIVHDAPSHLELQKPYIMAMIETSEGVRITAQIIDCDPADVYIGMKVRATMRKISEEGASGIIHYGYKFTPIN